VSASNRPLLALALLLAAAPADGDEAALLEKIERLEQRVQELESQQQGGAESSRTVDWSRRVRLGGSANTGFFGGAPDSLLDPDGFKIWDARFFLDAYLGEDVRMGETLLMRDVGLNFEWNLVRIGSADNNVGELYVDFQGIGGSDWLNFQVGRFQIPVGEAYLQYSRGYSKNFFVSNSFGPWWWDEGVRMYGASSGGDAFGRVGYVFSVSDGDTPFNTESDSDKQVTGKLFYEPWHWLRLSASALRTGELGATGANASGAPWLGEMWARPIGASSTQPNIVNGVAVPDAGPKLHETWLVGGDAIVDFEDKTRLWLAYGRYDIDANQGGFYDRTLHYWIAEWILRGAWLHEGLRPFYGGFRAQGLGGYDADEGYLLDMRRNNSVGWNMESITTYSGVVGWDITSWLRLRSEYTHQQIDLVRGATPAMRANARDADFYAIELGASF
jgi:hypothetical protein